MYFPNGFYVNNYVGTYKIAYSLMHREMIIVSREDTDANSLNKLTRTPVFKKAFENNEPIYIEFSNIKTSDAKSILTYCNKYGLPYSSQIIKQKRLWMEVDETNNRVDACADTVADTPQLSMEQLENRDYMTVKGFQRSVILVNRLVRLRTLTDAETLNCSEYTELLSLLIFFLFFSHEYDFDYDPREDAIPKTQLLRFQYAFQLFRHMNLLPVKATIAQQVGTFLHACQTAKQMRGKGIESKQLWAVIDSKSVENVLKRFAFLMVPLDGKCGSDREGLFSGTSYGEILFKEDVIKAPDAKDRAEMQRLGKEVLCDVINDGLRAITPILRFEEPTLKGDWELNFQMAGIFMEIYMDITNQFLVRQCANPTCGNFFSVSRNRPNKIYCSRECALLVAKRKERARKKARAEQFKAENQHTEAQE